MAPLFYGLDKGNIMTDNLPDVEGANGTRWEAKPVAIVDDKLLSGQTYLAGTDVTSVQSGSELMAIIRNPVASGKNIVITKRIFTNDLEVSDTPIQYQAWVNPTAPLTENATIVSLLLGGPSSAAEVVYQMAPFGTVSMGGTAGLSEILPRGVARERDLLLVIPEGYSIGFSLQGAGNNPSQSLNASIEFEWYEIDD